MDLNIAKFGIAGIVLGFGLLELAKRRFLHASLATVKDHLMDGISVILVPGIVIPTILFGASELTDTLFPGTQDQWAHWSRWLMFGVLLLADDMVQYFWHRLSHTSWLYPLHRAHHSAQYLSVRVVYRNHLIYYALMPSLWLSGMLIHWGFMAVYPMYVLVKMLVIISAHSSVAWDAPLHRNPMTRPFMWVIERLISTPSTHSMHHGLHEDDGVTHYKGNYGNLLFLWDVIFGTARITRKRPKGFGIEGLKPVTLVAELLWFKKAEPLDPIPAPSDSAPGTSDSTAT